jgi:CRP/FNR family transcriptional regulator
MIDPLTIRRLPLFAPLGPVAAAVLASRAVERRFAAGQVLYTRGSTPGGLLVIVEGRVRVVRGREGRQHLVHEEGQGGALGEVPVFSGGAYPATAIAAEPTCCVLLSTAALQATVRDHPELAFLFLRRLAERTRLLVDLVDRLAAQDVIGRLAGLLLERRRVDGGSAGITLGRTQVEVAEALGTVREVVVRALRQLRQRGLIEAAGRGRYLIRNPRGLARLAE